MRAHCPHLQKRFPTLRVTEKSRWIKGFAPAKSREVSHAKFRRGHFAFRETGHFAFRVSRFAKPDIPHLAFRSPFATAGLSHFAFRISRFAKPGISHFAFRETGHFAFRVSRNRTFRISSVGHYTSYPRTLRHENTLRESVSCRIRHVANSDSVHGLKPAVCSRRRQSGVPAARDSTRTYV